MKKLDVWWWNLLFSSSPGVLVEFEEFDPEWWDRFARRFLRQQQQQKISKMTTMNKNPPAAAPMMIAKWDSSFLPPGRPTWEKNVGL